MSHDINLLKIIDAIKKRSTHSNLMLPGLGVGGYCLTKDPLFIHFSNKKIFKNEKLKFNLNRISVQINKKMPNFVVELLKKNMKKINKKKFLLLKLHTKIISLTQEIHHLKIFIIFEKKKARVSFFDPFVKNWSETNLKSETLNHIKKTSYDCIIFLTNHSFQRIFY